MKIIRKYSAVLSLLMIFSRHVYGQSTAFTGKKETQNWQFTMSPVFGITNIDSAKKKWGDQSEKFLAWDEYRKIQYRDKGAAYFEKHPDDPSFKEWLLKAVSGREIPNYWKDIEKEASKQALYYSKGQTSSFLYDEKAESDWNNQYLFFRSLYLADTAVKKRDKEDFLSWEWAMKLYRLKSKMVNAVGNLEQVQLKYMPIIQTYAAEATGYFLNKNADPGKLRDVRDNFGPHDSVLYKSIQSILNQSRDTGLVNNMRKDQEITRQLRDNPVELKFPSLHGGKQIDLKDYRGKVVLLDFWNIHCGSCVAHMPKFENFYEKYKDKGFVIISVCAIGYDGKGNEAKEEAKAIELEKKHGLTYPSAKLNPVFYDNGFFGFNNQGLDNFITNGGSLYLFDQNGKLYVQQAVEGNWLEFYVRKRLGLNLDETGKQ